MIRLLRVVVLLSLPISLVSGCERVEQVVEAVQDEAKLRRVLGERYGATGHEILIESHAGGRSVATLTVEFAGPVRDLEREDARDIGRLLLERCRSDALPDSVVVILHGERWSGPVQRSRTVTFPFAVDEALAPGDEHSSRPGPNSAAPNYGHADRRGDG